MTGNCRLFGNPDTLRESHIFPAFAIDYLKNTGSKFLRTYKTPNLRNQDGLKKHLLSHTAEQRFGVKEKWFSEKIFIPYLQNNIRTFDYNDSLFYFSISFLWRILIMHTDFSPQLKNDWYFPKLLEVEKEWRDFLADYKFPENFNKVQLFFTDRVENITAEVKGFDYYTSRAFDGTIITNEEQSYLAVYGKFMRFVFWCVIKTNKNYTNPDSNINPVSGTLSIPQNFQDDYLMDFLINRSNKISGLPKPSPKQQQKILEEILKDREGFWNSDAGKAIYNDKFNLDKKKNSR